MTGPEFAHAHGDDSSTWKPADLEAAQVFASIDMQPVYLLLKQPPPAKTTPQPTPAA